MVFHNRRYFSSKKRRNIASSVQSDVTEVLPDSHGHTTYCLNTLTNIACVAGVNGGGVGIVCKKRKEERYGKAPFPDKEARFQQAAQFNFFNP